MRYFKNGATPPKVFGYNPATQETHIAAAVAAGWTDVSASWPPAPAAPSAPTVISSSAFLDRFTDAEDIAIHTAAQTSAAVASFLTRLAVTKTIDLKNPKIEAAIKALVVANLLTAARETAILTP
jgi:hypothetical protein